MVGNSSRTLKSILLLVGAFTFAFLLGEMIHEFGHYLCHRAYNNPDVQVHLDPFGGSMIMGAVSLPDKLFGITSAAGPLFSLVLGIASMLLLWRQREPILLPLLLWGPISMVQEGVTFSLGMLTPGGDAQWVAALGIPKLLILVFGLFLLITGVRMVSLFLLLVDVGWDDPFQRKLSIVGVGMCSLMVVRALHSFFVFPGTIMENFIPLVFSLLLSLVVVWLKVPVARKMSKTSLRIERSPATWSASIVALALGISMFTFQVIALN